MRMSRLLARARAIAAWGALALGVLGLPLTSGCGLIEDDVSTVRFELMPVKYGVDTRLVNVHVQRLRAKVELDPENPRIVTTVRGVGYRAGAAV